MAVEKKKVLRRREVKELVYNALVSLAPGKFPAGKVWTDVAYFGDDPEDSTKLLIEYNEEDDA